MTPAKTADILRQLHDWLRGGTQWAPTMGAEAVETAIEMIERADRLEKVESALSDLLNDLEERAKWNLEASQRVVACGNGVYVRAKAALEKSK